MVWNQANPDNSKHDSHFLLHFRYINTWTSLVLPFGYTMMGEINHKLSCFLTASIDEHQLEIKRNKKRC